MKTKKDWDKIINEWKNSNLSVESFCKEQQIARSTFYKYKRKSKQNNESIFEPVVIKPNDTVSFIINGVHITCNHHDIAAILEAVK